MATIILSLAAVCRAETTETMSLLPSFKRFDAPVTGRKVVQLTNGKGWNYPLYFFIPTITRDNKYLIHHFEAEDGQVQLYRLNLATGESWQLTRADCPDTQWWPWCVDSGRGMLDHRVLNVARNIVVYFNGNEVRAVDVETPRITPSPSQPRRRRPQAYRPPSTWTRRNASKWATSG